MNAPSRIRSLIASSLLSLVAACSGTPQGGAPGPAPTAPVAVPPAASATPPVPSAVASASAAPGKAELPFGDLVRSLSEPDGPFFSDNVISNETSYLQVGPEIARMSSPGGAYIGVGPEQNFTYIALTRPSVAFIVDIRRRNMVQHLLFKAIFAEATSRAHFLALLVGRPYEASGDPGAAGTIDAVIAHAERLPADEAAFKASHARLADRIDERYRLDAGDRKALAAIHQSFFKRQLDVRFELHEKNGRAYPTLRELLAQKDPEGKATGFLATEESFRFVQGLERDGRIIPVVGDFAGDRAMPGIAAYLRAAKIPVSAFYVSNVEQYLLEPAVWSKWARNVAALPADEKSLFVRAYLDQGRRHPRQMKGHRTATVLQRIVDFNDRQAKRPFTSFWDVTTEKIASGPAL